MQNGFYYNVRDKFNCLSNLNINQNIQLYANPTSVLYLSKGK